MIYGGDGRDYIDGRPDDDVIYACDGDDGFLNERHPVTGVRTSEAVAGGAGNDTIYGEGGNDKLKGQAGDDKLYGGVGNDRLDGGDGNNFLEGGEGDDILDAESGDDVLHGGAGDDSIESGGGNDIADGVVAEARRQVEAARVGPLLDEVLAGVIDEGRDGAQPRDQADVGRSAFRCWSWE